MKRHSHMSLFCPLFAPLMPFFPDKTQQCVFNRQFLILAVSLISNREPLCFNNSLTTPWSEAMTPKAQGLYLVL